MVKRAEACLLQIDAEQAQLQNSGRICASLDESRLVLWRDKGFMNLKLEQSASRAIVYDADCIKQPSPRMFEEAYWREASAVRHIASGRGNALMLETPFGPVVMRQYMRGGWMKHVSRDRYLFTGFASSRPLREAWMLAQMSLAELPVPKPVAAQCLRQGITYSGVLMTQQIMHSCTLADSVTGGETDSRIWKETGRCIRRFHEAGVVHPDLNASNILVTRDNGIIRIHLIDFDRAYFRSGARRLFRNNLNRLRRSLVKFWPAPSIPTLETCWASLMSGYHEFR